MKATGIVRKIDEMGRIVLPSELRRTLNLGEREPMEIFVEGTSIVLRRYSPTCLFCDNAKDVSYFKGRPICSRCLKQIKASD